MRYIIKNGKIYGIYNQNYSSLNGKPQINNHELAEGISYSSEDLGIVVGPISQAEYDAMPTHNPQTIYVVYDDEIDPSSTAINYNDLENKPQINGQVLTGNKPLSSLNIYSKEEVKNLIAAGRSISVVPTKPASPSPNTLYYVETSTQSVYHVYLYDSNTQEADLGLSTIDLSDYYTKTQADDRFEALSNKVNTITSASTTDEYPSAKAVYDYSAPIEIQKSLRATPAINPDNCIWNMTNKGISNYRVTEEKMFVNATITDPISSNSVFGTLKVLQIFSPGTNEGLTVVQDLIVVYKGNARVNNQMRFRRIGYDATCTDSTQITSATITWRNWYPVEYPSQRIESLVNTNNFTCSSFIYCVTGGIAYYDIYNLHPVNSFSSVISIIKEADFLKFSSLHKMNMRAIAFETSSTNKNFLFVESDITKALNAQSYTGIANYRTTFSVPLGY